MAKLTREDIVQLARLARLRLSEAEVDAFTQEISAILSYVEQLSAVDTKGLEPTYQVTGLTNVMRKDEPYDYGVDQLGLLKNVPATEQAYIKVERMVG
jgi:aspartyl-tRNA(Asn)/glutamyl-tRNA(Gln) amidotransferase subunit C